MCTLMQSIEQLSSTILTDLANPRDACQSSASVHNLELFLSFLHFPLFRLHLMHQTMSTPLLQLLLKLLQRLWRPLRFPRHITIPRVPHEPSNVLVDRSLLCEFAVEDALHFAGDSECDLFVRD